MNSWNQAIKRQADPSWHATLIRAINAMDQEFLEMLDKHPDWLPGKASFVRAFSIPVKNVNNILVGESPYPRKESSCGYCFYDADVNELWSEQGISKKANRATSLRNFLKMLIVAKGDATEGKTTKEDIASIDKSDYIQSSEELFIKKLVEEQGFLLLNLSLSLVGSIRKEREAKYWIPFMEIIFDDLSKLRPEANIVLFGKVAEAVSKFESAKNLKAITTEHPYNVSFIANKDAQNFFGRMNLLNK